MTIKELLKAFVVSYTFLCTKASSYLPYFRENMNNSAEKLSNQRECDEKLEKLLQEKYDRENFRFLF